MDEESAKILREATVEDINQAYKNHEMSAGRRNGLLRAKARLNMEEADMSSASAYGQTLYKLMIEHLEHGWENVKEAAQGIVTEPKHGNVVGEAWHQFYYAGLGFLGMLEMGFAPLSALGRANGETARRMALANGASPTVAHMLGLGVDLGTGFMPVGKTVQLGARGFRAGAQAGVFGKEIQTAATTMEQQKAMNFAFAEISRGLHSEGIDLRIPLGINPQFKLNLTGTVKEVGDLSDVIKPGMSKDAALQAVLVKLQREGIKLSDEGQNVAKERIASYLESQASLPGVAASQGGLNLSGVATETGDLTGVVKPGMTKEAAMEAALEHLRSEGTKITEEAKAFVEKRVTSWLEAQSSQAELPFREPFASIADALSELPKASITRLPFVEEVAKQARNITIKDAQEQLPELAKKLGINLENLKNTTPGLRGDPKNPLYENPKKMYGYLKALEARIEEIGPMARDALAGVPGADYKFGKYMADLFQSDPEGKMKVSKGFTDMLMHWDPENMARGDISAALQTFAKDIAFVAERPDTSVTLGTGFGSLGNLLTKSQGGYFVPWDVGTQAWAAIRNLYLNSLLPFSAVPAFVGNSYATGMTVAEHATGALFSSQNRSVVGNIPTAITTATTMSKALMFATMDGAKAFADAFRRMPQNAGRFSEEEVFAALGRYMNIPIDSVRGMDNFFSVLITRAVHYETAMKDARELGLKGGDFGKYVTEAVKNPTVAMQEIAKRFAEEATFQGQLGQYANDLRSVLQWGPGILYFPFMKTGINLGKYSWARTPGLQLFSKQLYQDLARGGTVGDAAIGRLVLSNLMGHMYFELAKDGLFTGDPPIDPHVARSWSATHEPNAVRAKEGWVPINNIEPANTVPTMIANIVQVLDQLDDPSSEQAAMTVGLAMMKGFGRNTWWQTTDKLIDVVQHVASGQSLTEMDLKAARAPVMAPLSAASRVTRVTDPLMREARNWQDEFLSKLPWRSKELPPVRDGYGDPRVPPQAWGGPWTGLMRPLVPAFRPYETDSLKKEGDRLNVKMPFFSDHLGGLLDPERQIAAPRPTDKPGIQLTPQERDQRIQIYRDLIRHEKFGIEAGLINNPKLDYAKMPEDLKRAEFEHALEQAWANAGQILAVKNPTLGRRVMESDLNATLPLIDEEKRADVETKMRDAIKKFETGAPEAQQNLMKWGIIGNELPDNVTYGTPYGPLTNVKEVPPGTSGAVK